jgi:serine palmitoyltransferase
MRYVIPYDFDLSCCANISQLLANNILIARLKSMPHIQNATIKEQGWLLQPALKVCVTTGLSSKDIEKSGASIRQAIAKVLARRTNNQSTSPIRVYIVRS